MPHVHLRRTCTLLSSGRASYYVCQIQFIYCVVHVLYFFIFCVVVLPVESRILKSLVVIVKFLFLSSILSIFPSYNCMVCYKVHKYLQLIRFLDVLDLLLILMSFVVFCNFFDLNSILSEINIAILVSSDYCSHRISFFICSLITICVFGSKVGLL